MTASLDIAQIDLVSTICIYYDFNPEMISLSSPDLIIFTIVNSLGYSSQLIFRLYLKYVKNNPESNELLTVYFVAILGGMYLFPLVSVLLKWSLEISCYLIIFLHFIVLPILILICHEGTYQYFVGKYPKVHEMISSLKSIYSQLVSNITSEEDSQTVVNEESSRSEARIQIQEPQMKIDLSKQTHTLIQVQPKLSNVYVIPVSPQRRVRSIQMPDVDV